jgi:hypothetical protein
MRIIQQLPSEDGMLYNNIIDNVRYVEKGSSFLRVVNDDEWIIKEFQSQKALSKAYSLLQNPNLIELHLEYPVFFEEPIYSNDVIAKSKYMKLDMHLQRVMQDLIQQYKFQSKELITLDAFKCLKPKDIHFALSGVINFQITYEMLSMWATTLPIPKLAALDGVTKKQYYEIQSSNLNIHNRVCEQLRTYNTNTSR